jgi:hypothetical protein
MTSRITLILLVIALLTIPLPWLRSNSAQSQPVKAGPRSYYLLNQLQEDVACTVVGTSSRGTGSFSRTLRARQGGRYELPLNLLDTITHLRISCRRPTGAVTPSSIIALKDLGDKHLVTTCSPHPSSPNSLRCEHTHQSSPPGPASTPRHVETPELLRVRNDYNRPITCQLYQQRGSNKLTLTNLDIPRSSVREIAFNTRGEEPVVFHCRPQHGYNSSTWTEPKHSFQARDIDGQLIYATCATRGVSLTCDATTRPR